MASVNKFIGIGNLGRDPETRYMPDGKAVTNISIACTEKYKDKNGEQKETTEWINVVFFGKLAEIVSQYAVKGSSMYVEGKIKTEKYQDKNTGVEKFSTKIIGESMQLLSSGKPRETGAGTAPRNTGAGAGGLAAMDEDIPF